MRSSTGWRGWTRLPSTCEPSASTIPPTTAPSTPPPSGGWNTRARHSVRDADLSVHVSPGTPAMQAVWVLLAKTRFPAALIQSHEKTGVRTVSVPFDIAAEYVPALLRETDDKLTRLTAGLPPESPEFDRIIGRSPALDRARTRARRIAPHDVTVLIEGESGTGKELFARAIHAESRRRGGPFEEVNCGALPEGLVESLLFGHTRGRVLWRGASPRRPLRGRRRRHALPRRDWRTAARRPGQAPPRVAGEGPSGGSDPTRRLPSMSGSSPPRTVTCGPRWRPAGSAKTSTYRLATGVIRLPPLRERQGDLTPLIDHFLAAGEPQVRRSARRRTEEPFPGGKEPSAAAPVSRERAGTPGDDRPAGTVGARRVGHRGRCPRRAPQDGSGRTGQSARPAAGQRAGAPELGCRSGPPLPRTSAGRGGLQQDPGGRARRPAELPDADQLDEAVRCDAS